MIAAAVAMFVGFVSVVSAGFVIGRRQRRLADRRTALELEHHRALATWREKVLQARDAGFPMEVWEADRQLHDAELVLDAIEEEQRTLRRQRARERQRSASSSVRLRAG